MTYWQSILLGVVQGLGEFLPISSSAHLVITPWLFDFKDPGLTFDIALHFGTLLALIAYFWRDWLNLIGGTVRATAGAIKGEIPADAREPLRIMIYLVLATIPGAVAGLLLEKFAETVFRTPLLIAVNMIVMGVLLFIADRNRANGKTLQTLSVWDALIIGLSQSFALIPGVSRSGITMTTGLFLGLSRVSAARFSFLMAAPITFGACLLKAKYFFSGHVTGQEYVGILVSGLVGFLSIKFLLKYVQAKDYKPFVYYRFVFAAVVFVSYFLKG